MLCALIILAGIVAAPCAQTGPSLSAAPPHARTPASDRLSDDLSRQVSAGLAGVERATTALTVALRRADRARESEDLFRVFWRWHEEMAAALGGGFFERRDLSHALTSIGRDGSRTIWNHPLEALSALPAARRDGIRRAAPTAFAELERYHRAGFDFSYGEGDWYLQTDARFIARLAETLPDGGLKAYARFRSAEADERVVEDAGLTLGWDHLRRRLARWEAFRRAHPGLPEAADGVDREVRQLVGIYLFGTDNSPIFAFDTGTVPGELRESYRRFLEQDTESAYHSAIAAAFDVLRKSGFRPSPELPAVLHRLLTHPAFAARLDGMRRQMEREPSSRGPWSRGPRPLPEKAAGARLRDESPIGRIS